MGCLLHFLSKEWIQARRVRALFLLVRLVAAALAGDDAVPELPESESGSMAIDHQRLDQIVLAARQAAEARVKGYREQALKLYPWICGRCAREFTLANVRELTVHHRDHNHDHNPPDGSNWELLCIYCHDNEHQKQIEVDRGYGDGRQTSPHATHSPFAGLKSLLKLDN